MILSDEIYARICYDGQPFSIASVPGMLEKTIIMDGFSKSYAMTGWRLGYGVMPEWLATAISKLMSNSNTCAASFVQRAAITGLEGPQTEVENMIEEFRRRRDMFIPALNKIPGFRCSMPSGAFYAFVNVTGTGLSSKEMEELLLNQAGVACLDGGAFGEHGEGYLRLSYANSFENLTEALRRIEEASKLMETGLRNRTAMVAGASQGMGRATARALAAEGVHLALCARNGEALRQLGSELAAEFRVEVHTASVDVADTAAVNDFVASTIGIFDRIDICVTNAGGPPPRLFLATTDEEWDSAFHLNLRSAAAFARAVIPHMQTRRWGRIITISSITVRQPQPELILSNAIRTGVMGLVRSLATDFGKDGILVNNVAPGYIATDRVKQLTTERAAANGQTLEEAEQGWVDQIPVGRLGRPEEIADTIVWLASERSSFINGQTILVDGGMYKGL